MAKVYVWGGRAKTGPDNFHVGGDVPPNLCIPLGVDVEFCPVYMRKPDPQSPASDRPWAHSARDTAAEIVDGNREAVFLNGLCRPTDYAPSVTSERGRLYWQGWAHEFGQNLKRFNASNKTLKYVIIDHARYPSRRLPSEMEWLNEDIVSVIAQSSGLRVGMYGTPSGLVYWKPYTRPSVEPTSNNIPWLIAPRQMRGPNDRVHNAEFMWALGETLGRSGDDIVAVWCDSANPWLMHNVWTNIVTLCTMALNYNAVQVINCEADRKEAERLRRERVERGGFDFNDMLANLSDKSTILGDSGFAGLIERLAESRDEDVELG